MFSYVDGRERSKGRYATRAFSKYVVWRSCILGKFIFSSGKVSFLARSSTLRGFRTRILCGVQKFSLINIGRLRNLYRAQMYKRVRSMLSEVTVPVAPLYDDSIFNCFRSVRFQEIDKILNPSGFIGINLELSQLRDYLMQVAVILDGVRLNSALKDREAYGPCYPNESFSGKKEYSRVNLTALEVKAAFRSLELAGLSMNQRDQDRPRVCIVVPVFNNGHHFLGRCLPSIVANRCFPQIEILVVDDGSWDEETVAILSELSKIIPNLRYYRPWVAPSGSASRARNYGTRIANSEFITYLDPDNEISPHAFDHLLRFVDHCELEGTPLDFISGFQYKVGSVISETARHAWGVLRVHSGYRDEVLKQKRLPLVSSQAAVISKQFLIRENIRFEKAAVGQDTLFGWEILLKAERFAFTDEVAIAYYSNRRGSVTNTVSLEFFERSLLREKAQVALLKEFALLDFYRARHLRRFVAEWYLPKLAEVDPGEAVSAAEILSEIVELYRPGPGNKSEDG